MDQGEIWWASLPEPAGSEPGYRRPLVIVHRNFLTERAGRLSPDLLEEILDGIELVLGRTQ